MVYLEAEAKLPILTNAKVHQNRQGASKVTKGFALTVAGKARLFKGDYAGSES